MNIRPSTLLFLLSLFLIAGSCKDKLHEIDYAPNVNAAKDYIKAEDAVFEIVNAFYKGVHDSLVLHTGYNYIDACDVVYFDESDSMVFSYGTVDRLCQDNKYRRGAFTVKFDGPLYEEEVTAFIATRLLTVDNLPYEASLQLKNSGVNNGFPDFQLIVNSSNLLLPDTSLAGGVLMTANFNLLWQEGFLTPNIHEDDTYIVSGNASGTSSKSFEFSVTIQDPLVNYLDCFWIERGLSQIVVPTAEFPEGTIDYITVDGCFNQMYFYFNDNLFYDIIK